MTLLAVPREMRALRKRGMVTVDSRTWRYQLTAAGRRKAISEARAILSFIQPSLRDRLAGKAV